MTPKILHQIYFREKEPGALLPPQLSNAVRELMNANPEWKHRLYDLASMRAWIGEHSHPDMLARFDSIAPGYGAAKADLFRYLVMEREGGVYLDIKIRVTQPLDALVVDDAYLLTQWDNGPGEDHAGWGVHPGLEAIEGGEYIQWIIASPAGSPILAAVIDEVCRRIDDYDPNTAGVGRDGVLSTTGPIAYSLAVERSKTEQPIRLVRPYQRLGLLFPGGDLSAQRGRLFGHSYITNWRPVVMRPGIKGVWQREVARMGYLFRQMARVKNIPQRIGRRTAADRS